MAPALPRARFHSARLIRLLADLAVADVAESKQGVAERLALWMDWTDAIALSGALNGATAPSPGDRRATRSAAPSAAVDAFIRVRRDLTQAILRETAHEPGEPDGGAPGYASYRQRYLAQQQAMERRIGPLRAQVRAALPGVAPGLRPLAALDAVLDEALGVRERHLLSKVPALLERHFERLRQAPAAPPQADPCTAPPAWLGGFQRDMQAVLLAELALRLQPVEGMIEAMGHEAPTQQGSHE